ncbi:autotransporter domain-containing protein [Edwardsiella tarda]|uniref:autotransporter domain-containing protein n=1 Tax=Edwardsiella tarda TaxID=636 RepID=UPI003A5ED790
MTGLGTLKTDNTGNSSAEALSSDGKVVAGDASTDVGRDQAFIWHDGDTKLTGLGTLNRDNTGRSWTKAISADGKVVVGQAEFGSYPQAFVWHDGDTEMTGLGTLKDNPHQGYSSAEAVSPNGSIVAGRAEIENGDMHAVIWKVKYPEPPVNPEPPTVKPEIIIVDKDNSHLAMMDTANRGFKVIDLYQSALNSLANARCQMGESNYCIGAFSQLDSVQDNSRIATGLFGSFKLPANNWTLGAAINFANQTRLIDNYDTRGSSKPGFGVFTRYQDNADGSGLNIDISAAYIQQDIAITRDKLSHTEAGKGESAVKGYQVGVSAMYAVNVNESTQFLPLAAITHHSVTRDGYSETRNAEFPAIYGEMGNERTELQLGINGRHQVNSSIQLDGGMGTKITLNEKRDAFTGHINYVGAYAYDKGETALARPYVHAGVNFAPTKNSTLRMSVGFEKPDYTNDAATVGLSYSYNW